MHKMSPMVHAHLLDALASSVFFIFLFLFPSNFLYFFFIQKEKGKSASLMHAHIRLRPGHFKLDWKLISWSLLRELFLWKILVFWVDETRSFILNLLVHAITFCQMNNASLTAFSPEKKVRTHSNYHRAHRPMRIHACSITTIFSFRKYLNTWIWPKTAGYIYSLHFQI
jgi:hypothetical protein